MEEPGASKYSYAGYDWSIQSFLEHQSDIESGNYNAGFENISILEIAEMIVKKFLLKLLLPNLTTQDPIGKIQINY